MWRRWLPRSVFLRCAVGFCATAPRDSCNDGKVIVNGHVQKLPMTIGVVERFCK